MTAKVGGGFAPVPGVKSQQEGISNEEFDLLKVKLKEALVAKLPELNEISRQIAENNKKIKAAQVMQVEGRAMQASASQKLELAEKGLQEVAKEREAITKERQNILTKQFYSIFNGKKSLPVEEIDTLFNAYLADRSLSVEKSSSGTSYPKINSMRSITQYLDKHPNIKICDLRPFKTEICDIPTLAEYLKHSTVKLVGIKDGISDDAKASLAEAVAARNGGLKVQYSA